MKTLLIVRGLSGSGKTEFATLVADTVVSADDFFVVHGEYQFDPTKLPQAHQWCQRTIRESLLLQPFRRVVAVANTFSQRWEMEPYLQMAEELSTRAHVVDLFDGGLDDDALAVRNSHGVPLATIQAMRERWEHQWRSGNPLPPWERN